MISPTEEMFETASQGTTSLPHTWVEVGMEVECLGVHFVLKLAYTFFVCYLSPLGAYVPHMSSDGRYLLLTLQGSNQKALVM